jgi:site-specific DNA-methyltransferase (adenine-specific)
MESNVIICGDCLEEMRRFPASSIDLIMTSPPYNLKNSSGGGFKSTNQKGKWGNAQLIQGYDAHNDNMPHAEYVAWQRECLTEMMRLIPDNGAIFYNHKWRVQNGVLQDRQDIVTGFPVRQIIIWQRSGGINFNDGYFLPTYEVIYMIAKPKFKLAPKANAHGDVWRIHQEHKNAHPAPFPVELAKRVISSTTAKTVLDPFAGSGTTAVAAKQLGVEYICIEKSKLYCDMATERLK